MNKTGFLYDLRYLLHDTGPYHPEMAERLQVIYKGIEDAQLLPHLVRISAQRADLKWIRGSSFRPIYPQIRRGVLFRQSLSGPSGQPDVRRHL